MSPAKSPPEQRYLRLASICQTFDDSLRAFDIIFSSQDSSSTPVNEADVTSAARLLAEYVCQNLQAESTQLDKIDI